MVSPGAIFPPAFSHFGLKDLHVSALGTGEGQTEGDDAGLQVSGAMLAGARLRGFGCNRFGSQQAPFPVQRHSPAAGPTPRMPMRKLTP